MARHVPDRVPIARFGAAHGIRGEVRLKSYTSDPKAARSYGPLDAPDGRTFVITHARAAAGTSPDMLVVRVEGVSDRNQAELLNGIELTIPRERLPATQEADEFYHADLIGLAAIGQDGAELGTVIAVQNFGAGDLLEIAPRRGPSLLVPFTRAVVPEIDIAGGRVVVDPPPGLLDGDGDDDGLNR